MPIPDMEKRQGLEFFAKWTLDYDEMSDKYLSDANGYDLIERDVF